MLVVVYLMYLVLIMFDEVLAENETIFDKFQQSDYKLQFERLDVGSFNKSILKRFETKTFKYNRTCAAMNLTMELIVDVGNQIEVVVQTYKFMSNEYRYFPVRIEINQCFAISRNLIGLGRLTKCGNFHGCPFQKGKTIHMCNWTLDESRFPPFVPSGRYMLEIQLMFDSAEAALLRGYGEITRPLAYD